MGRTATKPVGPTAGTAISFRAPNAAAVCVAGTLDDRNPAATPLTRRADGTWAVTLALLLGRHEDEFVVDGEWCCEPGCETTYHGCPRCVPNSSGTMNRLIEVT